MLRSFAYAASAAEQQRGEAAPEGWEERARDGVPRGLLRGGRRVAAAARARRRSSKLLSVFELEKAVYELRYELNNRPDWVGIPVAGIVRLLERRAAPPDVAARSARPIG